MGSWSILWLWIRRTIPHHWQVHQGFGVMHSSLKDDEGGRASDDLTDTKKQRLRKEMQLKCVVLAL